eukprot:5396220-Ditylum_brightwellii.AAC.1
MQDDDNDNESDQGSQWHLMTQIQTRICLTTRQMTCNNNFSLEGGRAQGGDLSPWNPNCAMTHWELNLWREKVGCTIGIFLYRCIGGILQQVIDHAVGTKSVFALLLLFDEAVLGLVRGIRVEEMIFGRRNF